MKTPSGVRPGALDSVSFSARAAVFSHPDSSEHTPDTLSVPELRRFMPLRLADCTAGRDLHPAPKTGSLDPFLLYAVRGGLSIRRRLNLANRSMGSRDMPLPRFALRVNRGRGRGRARDRRAAASRAILPKRSLRSVQAATVRHRGLFEPEPGLTRAGPKRRPLRSIPLGYRPRANGLMPGYAANRYAAPDPHDPTSCTGLNNHPQSPNKSPINCIFCIDIKFNLRYTLIVN